MALTGRGGSTPLSRMEEPAGNQRVLCVSGSAGWGPAFRPVVPMRYQFLPELQNRCFAWKAVDLPLRGPHAPLREKELRAWNPCLVTVRRARSEDATAMARVMAAVAEEGSIATEPPVDIEARAQQFRETIEGEGPRGAVGARGRRPSGGQCGRARGRPRCPLPRDGHSSPGARAGRPTRAARGDRRTRSRLRRAHKLELDVWPDNARAVRLYASAGFEVEGLRRAHYRRRDGSLRSALLMARLLGAGKR